LVGLDVEDELIEIAIRGENGMGDSGAVFYGDPQLFSRKNVITIPIRLPMGE